MLAVDIEQGLRDYLGVETADYSYIVVDQYGLLVIDCEKWPGGSIRGRSTDTKWSARFKGAPRQKFANPLRENSRRIDVLHRGILLHTDIALLTPERAASFTRLEDPAPRGSTWTDRRWLPPLPPRSARRPSVSHPAGHTKRWRRIRC